MSNVKTPEINYQIYQIGIRILKILNMKNSLGNSEKNYLLEKLIKLIEVSDKKLDIRTKDLIKKIVAKLRLVLNSNLYAIYLEIDKVNNLKICTYQTSMMPKKLEYSEIDNDAFRKIGVEALEKIKTILESLKVAIENADTDEEKLKEFVRSGLFLEILENGLRLQIKI